MHEAYRSKAYCYAHYAKNNFLTTFVNCTGELLQLRKRKSIKNQIATLAHVHVQERLFTASTPFDGLGDSLRINVI